MQTWPEAFWAVLVLLVVYPMAQYTAVNKLVLCQAANFPTSQPTLYNAPRDGKGRGKPDRRCADRPAAPMLPPRATIWLPGRRSRRPSGRRSLRRHSKRLSSAVVAGSQRSRTTLAPSTRRSSGRARPGASSCCTSMATTRPR
eukprot:scaffold95888_cov34-Phaeocystis_antarctica.AAC.1